MNVNVFIAGLSGERQYVKSFETFFNIKRRKGDAHYMMAETIGYAARSIVARKFLNNKKFDAIMLCDMDMVFPPDILERLRSHDLDMVTAHYYKRKTRPMQSSWGTTLTGEWPYIPMIDVPRSGLHELGTAGFGAVLIKRRVVEAVNEYLDGDDGATPFDTGPIPEINHNGTFGADMRFFWYASHLGFKLYGDASIDTPHGKEMWISHKLYDKLDHRLLNAHSLGDHFTVITERNGMDANAFATREKQLELEVEAANEALQLADRKLAVVSGQLAELRTIAQATKNNGQGKVVKLDDGRKAQVVGKLPTFADDNQSVSDEIANRHLASDGSNEEEALKKDAQ